MDIKELKTLRDKVYNLLSEYQTLHLLICKHIENPTEELHNTIIIKLNQLKKEEKQ